MTDIQARRKRSNIVEFSIVRQNPKRCLRDPHARQARICLPLEGVVHQYYDISENPPDARSIQDLRQETVV